MILTVQARWVNTRTTKLSKWDIQNVLSVCNFGLFSQITNSYSRWPFLISGDGTPRSTPSTAAAWKPTVCHFNHTAPHGGQFFTNAKTTVGCADSHYMTQRSSAELIISTACCALALCTWQYITQLWLTGDTAYDKPRRSCVEVGSNGCVLVLWMWSTAEDTR